MLLALLVISVGKHAGMSWHNTYCIVGLGAVRGSLVAA